MPSTGPISLEINAQALTRLGLALGSIGSSIGPRILAPALNRTGDQVHTAVRRSIQETLGAPARKVQAALTKKRASQGHLVYEIRAQGGRLPLSDYKSRESGAGVVANIYKRAIMHAGAFIVDRYSGKTFRRKTASRFPIEQIKGPSIAVEMMRDPTAAIPLRKVNEVFIPRVRHELIREMAKAKSRYGL